jgi:3-oxo-5alpha-steroid 4-dehydrogenase
MVQHFLPRHTRAITLGSPGCTGAGISLGTSVGAQTARMHCVDSARSLIIPKVFACGLLVDGEGQRFIAEDAYGATIGHEIIGNHSGKAWLILDAALFRAAWRLVMPWRAMLIRYRFRALMPLIFAWRRGKTLDELATACRIPQAALRSSLKRYNEAAAAGTDLLGKQTAHLKPLTAGPFFAINCSTDSVGYPPTSFTLGGLAVDEGTGQVLNTDGKAIAGLYAAGRTAVGIPSNFYVSGLSIADCVFSGRRAGQAAGESAAQTLTTSAAAGPMPVRVG